MYEATVPTELLEKLLCSTCGGYLSFTPLAINKNEQEICGKCFKALSRRDQQLYTRQRALETTLGKYVFPCRYHEVGCTFSFKFDADCGHEESCGFRYTYRKSPDKDNAQLLNNNAYETLPCEAQSPIYTEVPESVDMRIQQRQSYSERCHTCNNIIIKDVYTCLYGHSVCQTCKGNMCPLCTRQLTGKLSKCCESCRKLFPIDQLSRHECPSRTVKCPLGRCRDEIVFKDAVEHLSSKHRDACLRQLEATKAFGGLDVEWVMYDDGDLFKCSYYYFGTFVEFYVTYLGSAGEAGCYKYEVEVKTNDVVAKKRRACADWNNNMLERGVVFDVDKLVIENKKFEAVLRIFKK